MKAEGVSTYFLPDITVDVVSHRVLRNSEDIGLPDLSYRLLKILCENAPDVVSKDQLISTVWEHEAVSDETLSQRVRLLRKALGDDSPAARSIVSVRGRGYRVAAPVTVAAAQGLRTPVADVAVYNDYLLGQHLTFQLTQPDLERAVELLELVTARAPDFAEAFCSLGYAYSFLGTAYGGRAPHEVFHKAKSAVLRALSLRPDAADGHALYADILAWYDWDFETAEREHQTAQSLDPRRTVGYALTLSALARHEEAVGLLESQLKDYPDDVFVLRNLAWRYLDAGEYERAATLAASAPRHADSRTIEGLARIALGDVERGVELFEVDVESYPEDVYRLSNLARGLFLQGDLVRATDIEGRLHAHAKTRFVSPALLAAPRFGAGDADEGFSRLNDAVESRVRDVIFLKVSTVLNNYRHDARYVALLERVGLPLD